MWAVVNELDLDLWLVSYRSHALEGFDSFRMVDNVVSASIFLNFTGWFSESDLSDSSIVKQYEIQRKLIHESLRRLSTNGFLSQRAGAGSSKQYLLKEELQQQFREREADFLKLEKAIQLTWTLTLLKNNPDLDPESAESLASESWRQFKEAVSDWVVAKLRSPSDSAPDLQEFQVSSSENDSTSPAQSSLVVAFQEWLYAGDLLAKSYFRRMVGGTLAWLCLIGFETVWKTTIELSPKFEVWLDGNVILSALDLRQRLNYDFTDEIFTLMKNGTYPNISFHVHPAALAEVRDNCRAALGDIISVEQWSPDDAKDYIEDSDLDPGTIQFEFLKRVIENEHFDQVAWRDMLSDAERLIVDIGCHIEHSPKTDVEFESKVLDDLIGFRQKRVYRPDANRESLLSRLAAAVHERRKLYERNGSRAIPILLTTSGQFRKFARQNSSLDLSFVHTTETFFDELKRQAAESNADLNPQRQHSEGVPPLVSLLAGETALEVYEEWAARQPATAASLRSMIRQSLHNAWVRLLKGNSGALYHDSLVPRTLLAKEGENSLSDFALHSLIDERFVARSDQLSLWKQLWARKNEVETLGWQITDLTESSNVSVSNAESLVKFEDTIRLEQDKSRFLGSQRTLLAMLLIAAGGGLLAIASWGDLDDKIRIVVLVLSFVMMLLAMVGSLYLHRRWEFAPPVRGFFRDNIFTIIGLVLFLISILAPLVIANDDHSVSAAAAAAGGLSLLYGERDRLRKWRMPKELIE